MSGRPDIRAEGFKAWRLLTAPWRATPSFFLPGAPKCGTSTLYDHITSHPEMRRGFRKEPTNFVHYPGSRLRAAMNYPFRFSADAFSVVDGSVEYFVHPDGPANVHALVPDARLVFLVRDPVARAWSDYQMYRKHGTDRADFGETVEMAIRWLRDPNSVAIVDSAARNAFNPVRYVLCGMYARALERWMSVFEREQCLVLFTEEFSSHSKEVLNRVFDHLGLGPFDTGEIPVARKGGYDDWMSSNTEAALKEFFQEHDDKLAVMLGRDLPWR